MKSLTLLWKKASEEYDKAVFVTITLPPFIPLYIQKYAMTFLWYRIKVHLRKKNKITPHIYADDLHWLDNTLIENSITVDTF